MTLDTLIREFRQMAKNGIEKDEALDALLERDDLIDHEPDQQLVDAALDIVWGPDKENPDRAYDAWKDEGWTDESF